MKKIIYLFVITLFISCGKEKSNDNGKKGDGFDRKEMLSFWANDVIIPGYKELKEKITNMNVAIQEFLKLPSEGNLNIARNSWKTAYISWQKVSLFQIGRAEELDLAMNFNTYPTRIKMIEDSYGITRNGIKEYVEKEDFNFETPNKAPVQGFPALDYLLNGVKLNDTEIVEFYKNNPKWSEYLKAVSNRLKVLANDVEKDWKHYKTTFVNNDGNTQTSSVNKIVNYYVIKFYEHQLREPKIVIPAGIKINENKKFPEKVEAYYYEKNNYGNLSKELYMTALISAKDFFQGKSYNGTKTGKSLQQYLEFLGRNDLSKKINGDFDKIYKISEILNDSFLKQVNENKQKMYEVYRALQELLNRGFKPDMMSAMSIDNTTPDGGTDGD